LNFGDKNFDAYLDYRFRRLMSVVGFLRKLAVKNLVYYRQDTTILSHSDKVFYISSH